MIDSLKGSVKYLVLLVLVYMPIFGHLDTLPIRLWDESRLALNAYEMQKNGNLIVTYFDGKPDMWNTKPPLLIWMQAGLMEIIGVNELAVRIPSAIAAFLTCIVIILFSIKYLKEYWFGFIAVLVLITSHGYINTHASRTGDYDALLAFFTTLSGLSYFAFIETKKNKFLYLFFAALALSILTKGVTSLLFAPGLLIYTLWQEQLINILKNKHFYIGIVSFLFISLGYYFLREIKNEGYIEAVQMNELGGRYMNALEGHNAGFWYYYNNFLDFQLTSWYIYIPCGLLVGLSHNSSKMVKLSVFSTILILTFFLVISSAQTKIQWYDVPLYPYISILIAVFLFSIFNFLSSNQQILNTLKYNIAPFLFLFLVLIQPYKTIIAKTYFPKEYSWDVDSYRIGYFLKAAVAGQQDCNNYYLCEEGYNPQNTFYLKILQKKGIKISPKDCANLSVGEKAIAHQKNIKDFIDSHYNTEIIGQFDNVVKYKINGRK